MTTSAPRESAEIIQFPLRGRFAPDQDQAKGGASRFPKVAIGSNWYHDEAIQEAETARKN